MAPQTVVLVGSEHPGLVEGRTTRGPHLPPSRATMAPRQFLCADPGRGAWRGLQLEQQKRSPEARDP